MAADETARIVLDHIYGAVWRLMQTEAQFGGGRPWPEESRNAAELVVAATIGYLATAADQIGEGDQIRHLLVRLVASEAAR